eukprot:gnl/MRDRNA2_/MRDRNA2_28130_c0_seq1.p1 gnl/MRDRNA2_/MRDRNA2_28130_c0~~gnl/MRDRNA2_/MRDRNA2_28130_c0_seq1.p1  ORF type:complete len:185 (-),score=43.26 gnl/MRDRNA2_/MRDRNA2_28130_c0_seq1:132-686(-)
MAPDARQVHAHEVGPVTVVHISRDRPPFYKACPNQIQRNGVATICYKKAELLGDRWVCGAGHTCDSAPIPRWNLQNVTLCDASGHVKASAFGEEGDSLFNCSVQDVAALWERQQDAEATAQLDQIFDRVHFRRVNVRLRSKKEIWQDEEQVKVIMQKCDPYPGPQSIEAECRQKLQEVRDALRF